MPHTFVWFPAPSTCPAPAMPTPDRPIGALAARWQGVAAAAQFSLKHRDRRPRIAVPALVDRDTGVETLRRKAPLDSAVRVFIDERYAVRLIVRRGLGVAARGDAHAGNQRHDCAGEQCGCLFHLRFLPIIAGTHYCRPA